MKTIWFLYLVTQNKKTNKFFLLKITLDIVGNLAYSPNNFVMLIVQNV